MFFQKRLTKMQKMMKQKKRQSTSQNFFLIAGRRKQAQLDFLNILNTIEALQLQEQISLESSCKHTSTKS